MVIYRLFEEPVFPDPEDAEPDGLLAVGGDLSVTRLLTAYANGIFPWYSPDSPILWWSTDPRLVLFPEDLHVPGSLRRVLNQRRFDFTMDKDFRGVINGCARTPRPGQDGTWIVDEMVEAYSLLHDMGFAHSVEAWLDGKLVGGVYGVSLGRVFFGESMFYAVPDASKAAFVMLVRQLCRWGFRLIDCQQTTEHLLRFGAVELQRPDFIDRVRRSIDEDEPREGRWRFDWQRE
ncbi:leucyl/phenylalanyl-tRNA--protein transferase [Salidesulfovibrio onnuriiensis]|uniref:leucyl/phenylalanyl-tRNA--protein transferase n=1 Tax=Salidesulfovibrio onnuriiensis TaxID=2583823 RepID=UPI0011CC3C76|nr:leucyl/phenylalanyl-tRNA--protein transferase [Salidesulfovibrio onnuriiensis]